MNETDKKLEQLILEADDKGRSRETNSHEGFPKAQLSSKHKAYFKIDDISSSNTKLLWSWLINIKDSIEVSFVYLPIITLEHVPFLWTSICIS